MDEESKSMALNDSPSSDCYFSIIQDLLFNLNPKNIENTAKDLISICKQDNIPKFFSIVITEILNSFKIHPNLIGSYINLVTSFFGQFNLSIEQKNELLKSICYVFPSDDKYLYESRRLFFLNQLITANFFNVQLVIDLFRDMFHNFSNINNYLSLILIWFAPEISENDPNFYDEFLSFFVSIWEFEYSSLVMYDVYSDFDHYQANNWKFLKEHRESTFHKSILTKIIANDSVDDLQTLLSESNFHKNSRIPPSSYEWNSLLQKCPTLIQTAAYYGSINCFKYLLLNKANLEDKDYGGLSIVHFAIAGDNLEIIRILHQKHVSFAGSLQIAALYHRNDIFHWIYENIYSDLNEIHDGSGYILQQIIISNNVKLFNFCVSKGIDINIKNSAGIYI